MAKFNICPLCGCELDPGEKCDCRTPEPPKEEEYIKAYLQTFSQIKAAEACGVSRETIARAVRKANIKLDGRKLNGTGERINAMRKITDAELLEASETMTRQEIAEAYGLTAGEVRKRQNKINIIPKEGRANNDKYRYDTKNF